MKLFQFHQIKEAKKYALAGGQALHLHSLNQGHPVFRKYPVIAHLFDQDKERLILTVRKLGVRIIKIDRESQPFQHIDLCGKPLERAKQLCSEVITQ